MFVWMTGLLDVSRMWYTENQRKCFFEKVDDLYLDYCVHFAKEVLPADKVQEVEQRIRSGVKIEEWWDGESFGGYDVKRFEQEKVYPAMFDDLERNGYYWEEVCVNALPENVEDWYACSIVKSLLHEFVNDEEDPYKINDHLTEKEIACLTYTVCSIYVQYLKEHLHVDENDADYLLKLFYCGEFAQNEWLNVIFHENVKEIRHRVTRLFLYAFLSRKYNMGIHHQALFTEFLKDEVLSPIYIEIYDHRYEILKAGREYLSQNDNNRWTPQEMDNFYKYVVNNVKMEFKAPDFDGYR